MKIRIKYFIEFNELSDKLIKLNFARALHDFSFYLIILFSRKLILISKS